MSILQAKLARPGIVNARTFFESLCPRLLKIRAKQAEPLGGCFGFSLSGPSGGEWSVDLAAQRVTPKVVSHADVVLTMTVASFERLVNGTLSAESCFQEGRVEIRGKARLLAEFSRFLKPVEAGI